MALGPDGDERLARARSDLRTGVPVVLVGARAGDAASGATHDGAADGVTDAAIVAAVETLDADRLAALRRIGRPELAITRWRAETLNAAVHDDDLARLVVADDRDIDWLHAMADPAQDLAMPLKGPFRTIMSGDPALHRAALRLMKAARLLPAALVVRTARAMRIARDDLLTAIDAATIARTLARPAPLVEVSAARVPMHLAGEGRLHVFRPVGGGEEHCAIEIGTVRRDAPVLVRLHSACFTGDVLGSVKCDCGAQLHAAMQQMRDAGGGVLLYLDQEGRGIGLANKMRAYSLQDQGFDTVDANHRLGFEDDERDFRIGARILDALGIGCVRLLTNNPKKVRRLESCGIRVAARVPLRVGRTPQNAAYLDTKAAKSGHLL